MINLAKQSFSIHCKGQLVSFQGPVFMGILNLTPDSFYDGAWHQQLDAAIEHTAKMLAEGAHIIDVGGASSRPNAPIVSIQEEMDRILPSIEQMLKIFPNIIISVDTFHQEVAATAFKVGALIVNDISGGNLDEKMFPWLAKEKVPYVLSHLQGTPQNMQVQPKYNDVVLDILKELSIKVENLRAMGVNDILIDPGFGFGKTLEQNYRLLAHLRLFKETLGLPILVGLSRKSMLYKPLQILPKDSLNASIAAQVLALQNGAQVLRVHDVKAAKEAAYIWQMMQEQL